MKFVATTVARPIRVEFNGAKDRNDQWMRIRCARTNEILHTGQKRYIKAVAKKKYGHKVVDVA